MKKQDTNRKHNFPDADLYMLMLEKIQFALRDYDEFKHYNIDKERLKSIQNKCARFRELPDDDEMVGDQMILTEKKYKAADKLRNAIRSVMTRVAMKYSNRTGRYRKFGTAKLGDMTDAQLIFCGRRVVRVARQQLPFLEDVGMSDTIIARVTDAVQAFERSVNIQHDKVAERDIAVERRVDVGNVIYDELVLLCNIGKDIWVEKDPTKYENYTLYESNNEQKKARKAKLAKENGNK